ncbi:MAG: putative anti-sigma regulatory factor, serine/threonine protein kinase [Frankiales bacterium]|nr:putative anti-sigma regulatory factor, serine/threonine protein kinase [Frankiales bacterium]
MIESPTGKAESTQLWVPADPSYVSVLRTVTASLAARRDFTIEEIDDLRLAVDEASALLLPHTLDGGQLRATFEVDADSLEVEVTVATDPAAEPPRLDESSFAWMVLAALADVVGMDVRTGSLALTLRKTRRVRT